MAMSRSGSLPFALMMVALAAPASAPAQVDPHLLQALKWRSIGPFRGGRVLTVSGVPGEPDHFYFGAVNGGVWETRDAGRTWHTDLRCGAGRLDRRAGGRPLGSAASSMSAPARPTCARTSPRERACSARATAGHSWQRDRTRRLPADRPHPRRSRTMRTCVLVAALGHPYGANEMRGVFRSTDGGKTWQRTLYRDADTGAIDLAAEPGTPEHRVRGAVADTPAAVECLSAVERARRRAVQVGGRRADLDGADAATACPSSPGRIGLAISHPRCRSACSRSSMRRTAASTARTMRRRELARV